MYKILEYHDIRISPLFGNYLILKEVGQEVYLGIEIDDLEALAVYNTIKGGTLQEPITVVSYAETLLTIGTKLIRVEIVGHEDDVVARLHLSNKDVNFVQKVHPVDGLILGIFHQALIEADLELPYLDAQPWIPFSDHKLKAISRGVKFLDRDDLDSFESLRGE